MDHIQQHTEEDPNERLYNFSCIIAHHGPMRKGKIHYIGCSYNVVVEWDTGETTAELLLLISKTDSVTCAINAKQQNLLETPGWPYLKRYI